MMQYVLEDRLTATEFVDVLRRSGLAERRPVDDLGRMEKMLTGADLIATARNDCGLLCGVGRALTDFAYCTYLADLAVDEKYQRQGIGRKLLRLIHESAGLDTRLILLAAPKAVSYYPYIGMERHESCWIIDP